MATKDNAISKEALRRLEKINVPFSSDSFFQCVQDQNLNAVRDFLAAGMDPNVKDAFDATALMIAANKGYADMAKILLENGAGVNIKSDDGITALMAAAYRGYEDIVRMLLEQGADVHVESESGLTALMAAESINHAAIIRLLKDAGAKGGL